MPKAPEFAKDSGACHLEDLGQSPNGHVRPHLVLEVSLSRKKRTGLQGPGPGPDEFHSGRIPGWLQSGDFQVRGEKTKAPHPATHQSVSEVPRIHGALSDALFSYDVYKKATMIQPNSLGSLAGVEPTKSTEMRYFCPGSI